MLLERLYKKSPVLITFRQFVLLPNLQTSSNKNVVNQYSTARCSCYGDVFHTAQFVSFISSFAHLNKEKKNNEHTHTLIRRKIKFLFILRIQKQRKNTKEKKGEGGTEKGENAIIKNQHTQTFLLNYSFYSIVNVHTFTCWSMHYSYHLLCPLSLPQGSNSMLFQVMSDGKILLFHSN